MLKKLALVFLVIFCATALSACTILQKPKNSGLQVSTGEIKASVYLNDNFLERTPFINKNLAEGTYMIKIVPDDPSYLPYETQINLKNETLSVVVWKLGKKPEFSGGVIYEMVALSDKNKTEVSFNTVPDGAIIKINDKEKVFSPVTFSDITEGEHMYEISLPSYESLNHTINVIKGYRMVVNSKLSKIDIAEQDKKEPASNSAEIKIASQSANMVRIKSTNFFENNVEVLRVRKQANATASAVGFAKVGESYKYLGITSQDNWLYIELDATISGWVSGSYAEAYYKN